MQCIDPNLFWNLFLKFDTFDGAKPRFLNRGEKRRSGSTLSILRASDRGVEWVDYWILSFFFVALTFRPF
jgi:hypothetical protein